MICIVPGRSIYLSACRCEPWIENGDENKKKGGGVFIASRLPALSLFTHSYTLYTFALETLSAPSLSPPTLSVRLAPFLSHSSHKRAVWSAEHGAFNLRRTCAVLELRRTGSLPQICVVEGEGRKGGEKERKGYIAGSTLVVFQQLLWWEINWWEKSKSNRQEQQEEGP